MSTTEAAMSEAPARAKGVNASGTVAAAWLRALQLTAKITQRPSCLLSTIVEEQADCAAHAPALLSDAGCFTYQELSGRMHQYARWALAQHVKKGDVVCLLMPNQLDYVAIWLGISSIGGVVALLNTNLVGPSLSHCIQAVTPTHLIVSADSLDTATESLRTVKVAPSVWVHGAHSAAFPCIDAEAAQYSGDSLSDIAGKVSDDQECAVVTVEDRALYIYTSGTTGLPKAASVSHARVMQWSYWFAEMMQAQSSDRIYNCLPLYHSVGGVQAVGATLVAGGSLVIREKFSASHFWNDIVRWECTIFQYIGELCRYLLRSPNPSDQIEHRLRLACGNGLAADVWEPFQDRFRIPQILEFYASTEGGVSLFNVEGKQGSVGRVPAYLAHRYAPALVRFDVATEMPMRDEQGFCIRCERDEVGEVLGKIVDDPTSIGSRFEGYASQAATDKKLLHNVFQAGDCWVRTGDLMRKDHKGFYYFVDRVGDTFRWKGENVASSEVAEVIRTFEAIEDVTVYGVDIPATDGRAGMASIVSNREFDLPAFREHLRKRLPTFACPLFLRVRRAIEVTGTFKYAKSDLVQQGYNPGASSDLLYFDDASVQAFVPLDQGTYQRIQDGHLRL